MVNPKVQKELDKAQEKFDEFADQIKEHSKDCFGQAPVLETEPQTQLSRREIKNTKEITLVPTRTIFPFVNPKTGESEKFNETYREEYEYRKEFVNFIVENEEIKGEAVTTWTKPYKGVPALEWTIPANKIVRGPRYLAEQLCECKYNVMISEQAPAGEHNGMTFYGTMVTKHQKQRINALPVSNSIRSKF